MRTWLRRLVLPLLLVAGLAEAEHLADSYYYGQSHDYYHAAEVYWEEQSTLLLYLPHRYLFWTLKPNIRLHATEQARVFGPRKEDNGEHRWDWVIRVGPKGFRGPDFPAQKPPNELRVACFGDSRTLGEALAEHETYAARLQQLLEARLGDRSVSVLNLGADGWSSYQGLALLEREALDYAPDVAVFAFGINDTDTDWNQSDAERAKLLDTPYVTLQRDLYRSTAFYCAERQLLWARGRIFGRHRVTRPDLERRSGRTPRATPLEYVARLRRFVAVCREHGVTPLLLVVPVNPYQDWEPFTPATSDYAQRRARADELREQGDLDAAHRERTRSLEPTVFAQYNRLATTAAVEAGVEVVDASPAFFEALRYQQLYADEMHPNAAGAELIAGQLNDAVVRAALARVRP